MRRRQRNTLLDEGDRFTEHVTVLIVVGLLFLAGLAWLVSQ